MKYTKFHQLGNKGKEGVTYLVKNDTGKTYAMKTFRPSKSADKLKHEYKLLRMAGKAGVAPRAIDYSKTDKYIVMEKMDQHLYDYLHHNQNKFPKKFQLRLLTIFETLDRIGIFHNDANLCNYMLKDNELYLIDYGLAKLITPSLQKKLNTPNPNITFMLLGFVLKMRDMDCPYTSYQFLIKKIPEETVLQFGLTKNRQ